MTVLKRCPFCGGKARLLMCSPSVPWTEPSVTWVIACDACRAQTQESLTEKQAVEVWNHRADGWVNVEDRFPDCDDVVIVADGKDLPRLGRRLAELYSGKENWEVVSLYGVGYKTTAVTHWQPLPELPRVSVPEVCDICLFASQIGWNYCPHCGCELDRLRMQDETT